MASASTSRSAGEAQLRRWRAAAKVTAPVTLGVAFGVNKAYDRLLINARGGGRIFDGGVGTGEFSKPVVGAATPFVGEWLCQSGSFSGARCNIVVKAKNVNINTDLGYVNYGTVKAEQVDHQNAVAKGDSGGPMFALNWPNANQVIAKGTNTAIDLGAQTACTGVATVCAWRTYFTDITTSLAGYPGASIVTR